MISWGLIHISSVARDIEHIFICLFDMNVSFVIMCLFIPTAHLENGMGFPHLFMSLAVAGGFFTTSATWEASPAKIKQTNKQKLK